MKSMLIAVGLLGASIAALVLATTRKEPARLDVASLPEWSRGTHAMG